VSANLYMCIRPEWPRLPWNRERLAEPLAAVCYEQGRLRGRMEASGLRHRQEAVLQIFTEDGCAEER
jgi:hypothetical protein